MIDFSKIDPVIHEKTRLSIITLLASRVSAWSFADMRDELGLSDGNLITHLRALENVGYVQNSKESGDGRPRTSYALTDLGAKAFREYLDLLAQLVAMTPTAKKKEK